MQAARWSQTRDGTGYIYSFNGPQSLFVDTIRSCRALALSHQLGHALMGERDERISLLQRLVEHATNTARFNIWYGEEPRRLRRARPHGPRKRLQHEQRRLPLPLDRSKAIRRSARGPAAWPGRCSASPNSSSGSRRAPTTSSTPIGGRDGDRSDVPESRPRHLRLLHPRNADRRHPLLGHRRPRPREARRLSRSARRPVQRPRTGRQLRRRDRRAGPVAARPLPRPRSAAKRSRASATSKPASRSLNTLLDEPYLSTDREAPGPDPALGLPSAERLGLHPARPQSALRRIEHVGRLPRPRSRAVRRATGRERTVLHVLRPDRK